MCQPQQLAKRSPDGKDLDRPGRTTQAIWDARTGKPLTEPLEHRATVYAAAFSPDGARVVTASADNTARVWELPIDAGSLDEWQHRARCAPFALENGVLVENRAPCP